MIKLLEYDLLQIYIGQGVGMVSSDGESEIWCLILSVIHKKTL
jgi:hypothetical protein